MQRANKMTITQLVTTAAALAIGLILPVFFHMVGALGPVFLPMHIPVLLCGLLCGWRCGLICGILTPLLSALLTGMPPLYPTGVIMMLEVGMYGLAGGLLMAKVRVKGRVYIAMIGAMLLGRIVLGVASTVLLGLAGTPYSFAAFLTASFVKALPGIAIQLAIIPPVFLLLQRVKVIRDAR